MTIIKRKITALIAMLALVLGLGVIASPASAAPARPAATSSSWTGCGQSYSLGTRVCVDRTTGFGAVLYIYTDSSNVATTTFGVDGTDAGLVASFTATQYEYIDGGNHTSYVTGVPYGGSSFTFTVNDSAGDAYTTLGLTTAQADLVEWYSGQPGYEFVFAS